MRSKSNLRTKAEKESTQSGKLSNLRNRIKGLLYVPAGELIPNDDNFRGHPEDQRKVLDAAMTTIGIVGACVAYENDQGQLVLIDGHLRREEVDKNQELPVIVLDVNEKEARQVLATYDSVGALATINQDILLELLDEIKSESIEDGDEYDIISACIIEGLDLSIETETPGLTDPDDVPEPPEEPIAKTGDLWILGEHRLLCGDSTKPEDVERLMGGEKADIVFTSPPYGQQRDYKNKIDDWEQLMEGVFGNQRARQMGARTTGGFAGGLAKPLPSDGPPRENIDQRRCARFSDGSAPARCTAGS